MSKWLKLDHNDFKAQLESLKSFLLDPSVDESKNQSPQNESRIRSGEVFEKELAHGQEN